MTFETPTMSIRPFDESGSRARADSASCRRRTHLPRVDPIRFVRERHAFAHIDRADDFDDLRRARRRSHSSVARKDRRERSRNCGIFLAMLAAACSHFAAN